MIRFIVLIGLLLVLVIPAHAVCSASSEGGGFTCVSSNSGQGSTSATTPLTNHTRGDLIFVGCKFVDTNANHISISNTAGYTWLSARTPIFVSGGSYFMTAWYAVVPSVFSGVDSITCHDTTGTSINIEAVEWGGTDIVSPLDGIGASATSVMGTAIASGSYTVTPGDLNVGFCSGQPVNTAGAGWTNRVTESGNRLLINAQLANGSTANATCTGGGSGLWTAIGVAFKPFSAPAVISGGPTCGKINDVGIYVPSDYLTSSSIPPSAKGANYVDSTFGCTVYRITNGPADFGDSAGESHNYIMTPINLDDTMILTESGGLEIRAFPSGQMLVPTTDPSLNHFNPSLGEQVWSTVSPNKFYYLGNQSPTPGTSTQLMTYNVYLTRAIGAVASGSNIINVASANGIIPNASITIQGAGTAGALYDAVVGPGYVRGSTVVPLTVSIGTTVTSPVVTIGYNTVRHDFAGTYINLSRGGHGSIASSTCCMAVMGELPNGSWQLFAYDFTTDTVHTPAFATLPNTSGVTVSSTASQNSGTITFAKTSGTGDWTCATAQGGACQFQVAGDSTVYSFTGCYGYGAPYCVIPAGNTATLTFTPTLTMTENTGAAVALYFKPNDPRIIGNGYISHEMFNDTSHAGYSLYDINMNFLDTPILLWGSGGTHNDQGIDPANGHPTVYAGTGNDTTTSSCGYNVAGLEKTDMITSTRVCIQHPTSFNQSGHISLSANGQWLAGEANDAVTGTACIASCLPGNWASLWGYLYNEIALSNVDTTDSYRMAHDYARVQGTGYWAQPRTALSYDAKWIVFDSNFDMENFISGNTNYVDVYAVSTGIFPSVICVK